MSANSYSFNIGHIACTMLLDGMRVVGKQGILRRFPTLVEAEVRQAYADIDLSLDAAADSFNMLLLAVGDDLVLIDAGEGGNPAGGELLTSLRQAGIEPEAITQVVITHMHGDHVMGLLTADQQPAFPNATYVLAKEELPYWQSRIETDVPKQRPILAMVRERGMRLIDLDEEIVPGISAVPLPGHTPGQIGILIESENERLLHLSDLLHSPTQFAHTEWSASFDVDTSLSVPMRQRALGRAADEAVLTLFYHLTFPGLGYVKRADNGFIWEPLQMPL